MCIFLIENSVVTEFLKIMGVKYQLPFTFDTAWIRTKILKIKISAHTQKFIYNL